MIKYLTAHRATIVALIGVTLTYLTAKYGMTSPGPIQQGLQLAIPLAAVLGVHVSPSPFAVATPSPQAKHAATNGTPSPTPAPTPPSPPSVPVPAFTKYVDPLPVGSLEPTSFTIDTRIGALCRP